MTSREMKLVKFETMIRELVSKINYSSIYGAMFRYTYRSNPLTMIFGDEFQNEYAKLVIQEYGKIRISNATELQFEDIKGLLEAGKKFSNGDANSNVGAQVVFFGLVLMGIDNDSYSEKLSVLSDFAYVVGFDEDMMRDYLYAVKAILSAEKIDLEKMKSNNSTKFFANLV